MLTLFLKQGQNIERNYERTSGITKFVVININITQITCNLKCGVTIYISYTKEKNNAWRLLQAVKITLFVNIFSLFFCIIIPTKKNLLSEEVWSRSFMKLYMG